MKSKSIRFGLSLIFMATVSMMVSEPDVFETALFIVGITIFSLAEWES